jgi:hypothetical protein
MGAWWLVGSQLTGLLHEMSLIASSVRNLNTINSQNKLTHPQNQVAKWKESQFPFK